jgi:hypothetical protein
MARHCIGLRSCAWSTTMWLQDGARSIRSASSSSSAASAAEPPRGDLTPVTCLTHTGSGSLALTDPAETPELADCQTATCWPASDLAGGSSSTEPSLAGNEAHFDLACEHYL